MLSPAQCRGKARSRCSWRAHTATELAATGAVTLPACTSDTHRYVSSLRQFRKLCDSCNDARNLVMEAASGSSRRIGLHFFFESVDVALRDMEREERDVANGIAVFSPHQPDKAKIMRVAQSSCARLALFPHLRKLVLRPADCGFFAGFLAVLDALLLAPEHNCEIEIDWRMSGQEQHFTYLPKRASDCVWRTIFEPVHHKPRGTASSSRSGGGGEAIPGDGGVGECEQRFNLLFTARFRGFFARSVHNAQQRAAYHQVFRKYVRPSHPKLVAALDGLGKELQLGLSIGVHKRVDTPGTAEYQMSKRVMSNKQFLQVLGDLMRSIEQKHGRPVSAVFLATDDANAEAAFRAALGSRLRLRKGVQRVPGGLNADGTLNEVHIKSPHNPGCSADDAVDVVADTMLLACCRWVIHMDSNVTSAVALMNPKATMIHVADACGVHSPGLTQLA